MGMTTRNDRPATRARGRRWDWYVLALALAVAGGFGLLQLGPSGASVAGAPGGQEAAPAPAPISAAVKREALEAYGKLPLAFVRNAGQSDARVRYAAQASGASFAFTPREARFAFAKGRKGLALELRFLGASGRADPQGARQLPGKVNYLRGKDPAKWRTGLPTYKEVVYRELWPGIDLAFRGGAGTLKYELRLDPGADPGDIRLAYRGAERLSLGRTGGLSIETALGVLRDERPRSYQEIGGRRVPIASRFALERSGAYGFAVGDYDRRHRLVIDPGIVYSTYLGGSGLDEGQAIAVDGAGSAYVTGETSSADFPTTPGAFDTSYNGGDFDVFVTKLNQTGSTLLYSTYLGGNGFDLGTGIALGGAGTAHVTGVTFSADFPTTPGAFDTSYNGGGDAFVTRLDPTGAALLYSTYLGGSSLDQGFGIALDAAGNAHVAGQTRSAAFPTTPGAFDTSSNGALDAFVTKLDPTGAALLYSTYLGGSGVDVGRGIALDGAGSAHVTGQTDSADFPTTPGAFDTSFNGANDAFVTKLDQTGSTLLYSTYLGGSDFDEGFGIALDGPGDAHVTGFTGSTDFPTTPGAFDTTLSGVRNAFVTKLNQTGSTLLYSTYLGGNGVDAGFGIALDGAGSAHVTGQATSTNFPTTPGAFDTTLDGGGDAFVTRLNQTGSALLYSTYLGGSDFDVGHEIALDAAGSAYVTGFTNSTDFPTTPGAFDTSYNGDGDAFVTKLATAAVPATLVLTPPADVNPVGTSHTVTATVEDATGQPVEGVLVRFMVTGSVNATGECTTDSNGQCSFTYQGPPLPGADVITAYADTDEDETQDVGEPTGAATKAWVLPASTDFCEVTVTQGGWIVALNGDQASFGGNARVQEDGSVQGQENYQDHGPAQPRHVHSIELLALTCSDDLTIATIFGTATIDGSGTFAFRIDVTDQGEPGTNDTYGITLSDGYASGQQRLQGGNVRIHKS
jgi:hypothetical protein